MCLSPSPPHDRDWTGDLLYEMDLLFVHVSAPGVEARGQRWCHFSEVVLLGFCKEVWDLLTRQGWPASRGCIPSTGIVRVTTSGFSCGYWGWRWGPHAYTVSALPVELSFFFKDLFHFCFMYILPKCKYVHHVCACWSQRLEVVIRFLETGVTGSCEPPV